MRLALMQARSPAGNVAAGIAQVEQAIAAAGAAGAAMVVTPECFLPGYNHPDIPGTALESGGPWQERLARACARAGTGLVLGYAERADRVYNAALALSGRGEVLAHYRKIQLYGPREKALYTPGQAYATFDLGGVRAGLLICYDVEFAPHVAALAARGCQVLLVPTANMMPFTHVVEATVQAQAANHGMTVVYANLCGVEGDLTYVGGSLIAGPHGEVLARAGLGPALLMADLPARDPARLSTQAQDFRPVP